MRKRRILTRAKRNGAALDETVDYRLARRELKDPISRSKKLKWEKLRDDLNNNLWGLGYKLVMKKLGTNRPLPELDCQTMTNIVNTLFPDHEQRADEDITASALSPPLFTSEELQGAARSLKSNKAPGPDRVPPEVLRHIAEERPRVLLDMYNACLTRGVFPKRWKRQKLMLISKEKGDPTQASAYRPLCMLDSAGKLLEKLLKFRLSAAVENAGSR